MWLVQCIWTCNMNSSLIFEKEGHNDRVFQQDRAPPRIHITVCDFLDWEFLWKQIGTCSPTTGLPCSLTYTTRSLLQGVYKWFCLHCAVACHFAGTSSEDSNCCGYTDHAYECVHSSTDMIWVWLLTGSSMNICELLSVGHKNLIIYPTKILLIFITVPLFSWAVLQYKCIYFVWPPCIIVASCAQNICATKMLKLIKCTCWSF